MILICNLIGLIFPFWYFSILLNMIKVEGFIFPKCQKEKKKTAKKEKKKKVPMKKWTPDLCILHSNVLLLSHRDSSVSEVCW